MSVEALAWALNDAPELPKHLVTVLLGLANHADANGKGAYPSQATLAWYARKDERSVRRDLEQLEELKLIEPGDQRYVLHLPPDKRPVVYDLAMHRRREPRPVAATGGRPRKDPQVAGPVETEGTSTSGGFVDPTENRGDVDVRPDVDVKTGGTPTANRGDVDVPQTVLEPPVEPPPPPGSSRNTGTAKPEGEADRPKSAGPGVAAFVAELRAIAPHWSGRKIRAALDHPEVTDHPVDVVQAALRSLAAGDHGRTDSPLRVAGAGPWWLAAYRVVRPAEAEPGPSLPRQNRGPCRYGCSQGFVEAAGRSNLGCPDCLPAVHETQLRRSNVATWDDLLALVSAAG